MHEADGVPERTSGNGKQQAVHFNGLGAALSGDTGDEEEQEEDVKASNNVTEVSPIEIASTYREPRLSYAVRTNRVWKMNKDQWGELAGRHYLDSGTSLELSSSATGCTQTRENPPAPRGQPSITISKYASARFHWETRRSVCGLPVMDPSSRVPRIWTAFIMGVDLTYTAFMVPVSVGYSTDQTRGVVGWFDFVAGWIFLSTLVMGFHIGYVAQYKMERLVVLSGPEVAKYYIRRGTFVIDLISAAVYLLQILFFVLAQTGVLGRESPIAAGSAITLIQLFRMIRLLALIGMFKDLLLTASTGGSKKLRQWLKPSVLYMAVISYMLAWVLNSAAALWFYVGSYNSTHSKGNWIASYLDSPLIPECYFVHFDWQDPPELLPQGCAQEDGTALPGAPSLTFLTSFMLCIYFAVTTMTTVGYGDIIPISTAETAVAVLIMMAGIMTFAVLIGSMQEVFKSASDVVKNSTLLRQKLEDVDRWMLGRNMSSRLKSRIRRFYHEEWVQVGEAELEVQVFEELPPALRGSVAYELTRDLLCELPCFRGLKGEQRNVIASKLSPVSICGGTDLCLQGEDAESLWILQEGSIVVLYGNDVEATESAPTTLGETAVLAHLDSQLSTRQGGYRATSSCFLWELRMRDLHALMKQRPDIAKSVQSEVARNFVMRAEQCEQLKHMDLGLLRRSVDHPSYELKESASALPEAGAASELTSPPQDITQPVRVTGFGEISMEGVMNVMKAARKLQKSTRPNWKGGDDQANHVKSDDDIPKGTNLGDKDSRIVREVDSVVSSRTDELLQEVLSQMKSLESRMSQVERTLRRSAHAR